MKLVSFNILSDDYIEFQNTRFLRTYYKGIPPDMLRMRNRLPHVLRKLKELDADIYMLQEVMTDVRDEFRRQFRNYHVGPIAYHHFKQDDANSNRTGNVIMVRKSIGKPVFWPASLGRGYAISLCKLKWTAPYGDCQEALVASIHLDDTRYKYIQAQHLLDLLEGYQPCDVILGGDFNTASKKLHGAVREYFDQDVSATLPGTYLCKAPTIDYIYTTLPVKSVLIDNQPLTDADSCPVKTLLEFGSDHHPVSAIV